MFLYSCGVSMAMMCWRAISTRLGNETGSARFGAVLGLSFVALLVLLFASQLFTLASDADTNISATGASNFFHELPTIFYILGVGAVAMASGSLLFWVVNQMNAGGRRR